MKLPLMDLERIRPTHFVPKWIMNEHRARYEFAASFVKGKIVVDGACGSGIGSRLLIQSEAVRVKAYDISEECILPARQIESRVQFEVADLAHLPLPDAYCDVYVSFETIEHIDLARSFLKEVRRVLKEDGIFICSTPNREVINPGASLRDKPWNPFHIREYSREELSALLQETFSSVEMFGQNPVSKTKVYLFNRWGKRGFRGLLVKLNQAVKIPFLLLDTLDRHRVHPLNPDQEVEYLCAVCSNRA